MRVNPSLMKEIHLDQLRKTLKSVKRISKPQLAEQTGLSVVTVNSLVKILLKSGEIIEDEVLPSGGGRPPVTYRFNATHGLALTIYMCEESGIDTAFISIDNLYGEHIEKKKQALPDISLKSFDALIDPLLAKYPTIKVLAFGLPGTEVNGRLLLIDYKRLQGQSFTEYYQAKYNLPVVFENDLNAAVTGYCYTHDLTAQATVIGIYFPEKYLPGAGIFINGQIYKGRDGIAGEITYLPDIDWLQFSDTSEKLKATLVKIIVSMTSLYNPHRIILYGDQLSPMIGDQVRSACTMQIKQFLLPDIVVSKNFNVDFANGIRRIALNQLEPACPLSQKQGGFS